LLSRACESQAFREHSRRACEQTVANARGLRDHMLEADCCFDVWLFACILAFSRFAESRQLSLIIESFRWDTYVLIFMDCPFRAYEASGRFFPVVNLV